MVAAVDMGDWRAWVAVLDFDDDEEEVELEDDGDEPLSADLAPNISANIATRLNNVKNFLLSILAPLVLALLPVFYLFNLFYLQSCLDLTWLDLTWNVFL